LCRSSRPRYCASCSRTQSPQPSVYPARALCLAVETGDFLFASKLIDGTFPDYQRIIPAVSANNASVDRAELAVALRRLAAVESDVPLVALQWTDGNEIVLFLPAAPDNGHDVVAAEARGSALLAAPITQLAQLIDRLNGERITLDIDDSGPIRVSVVGDASTLALQTGSHWNFAKRQMEDAK
jgi:hypothetical protein